MDWRTGAGGGGTNLAIQQMAERPCRKPLNVQSSTQPASKEAYFTHLDRKKKETYYFSFLTGYLKLVPLVVIQIMELA